LPFPAAVLRPIPRTLFSLAFYTPYMVCLWLNGIEHPEPTYLAASQYRCIVKHAFGLGPLN
ncbi:hypothetical protein, partial [Synechococcus sp. UW140]|uniref:hypothetical protein n=1 Tax=Synechococcus sp. UW140 TaxID=368503 RepID=UPI003137E809